MERLLSSRIKKILLGVAISDGCVKNARFDFFIKSQQYAEYITDVLNQVTGTTTRLYYKENKRKGFY